MKTSQICTENLYITTKENRIYIAFPVLKNFPNVALKLM